jgi:hypothetical protein
MQARMEPPITFVVYYGSIVSVGEQKEGCIYSRGRLKRQRMEPWLADLRRPKQREPTEKGKQSLAWHEHEHEQQAGGGPDEA